jgi:hypothetical protein
MTMEFERTNTEMLKSQEVIAMYDLLKHVYNSENPLHIRPIDKMQKIGITLRSLEGTMTDRAAIWKNETNVDKLAYADKVERHLHTIANILLKDGFIDSGYYIDMYSQQFGAGSDYEPLLQAVLLTHKLCQQADIALGPEEVYSNYGPFQMKSLPWNN